MSYIHVYMSAGLKNWIDNVRRATEQGRMSPKQHDAIMAGIIERLQYFKDILLQFNPGPERAQALHEALRQVIENNKKEETEGWKKLSCKKGCSHCCMQMVEVTTDEGRLILKYIKENNIQYDQQKLERHAQMEHDPDKWWNLKNEEKECIFLKNNECQIYPVRPISCRKYFVITDPIICGDPNSPDVGVMIIPDAEILASAAFDLDKNESYYENMPKVLVKLQTKP